MLDQGVHERTRVGRVGDDRIGVAICVEDQGVLPGRDVAELETLRAELAVARKLDEIMNRLERLEAAPRSSLRAVSS